MSNPNCFMRCLCGQKMCTYGLDKQAINVLNRSFLCYFACLRPTFHREKQGCKALRWARNGGQNSLLASFSSHSAFKKPRA